MPGVCGVFKSSSSECTILTPCFAQSIGMPLVESLLSMTFAHSVAVSVPHFVSVEMIERLISTFRMRTRVAVMRIEAIINVAVEAARAVEPGADPDEHSAVETFGPIVA